MIALALALAVTATDKVDLRPEADLTLSGLAFLGATIPELLKSQLTPAECRWCDGSDNTGLPGTGSRGSLNGVDAWFHDATTGWLVSRGTASTLSDIWANVLIPGAALAGAFTTTGPYATDGAGWRAAAIIGESALVSVALVQGLKLVTVRKRPFVRYGNGETSGIYDVSNPDSRLGYASGHTVVATSLGFALATTATIQESAAAPWLWAAAAFGTVSTGTLRMMAEKHYFTDVATSALVGATCGVVIPLLHKRGGPLSSNSMSIAAQGPALSVSGSF
jgi:membrane-associated phospholipid phosphatase